MAPVEEPAWALASALRLAHPRFSTHPVVAARLSEEKRLARLAEEAIKVRPRRRTKKSSRTRKKRLDAGVRKAMMAASDGADAGGGCTGSRGAAR